MSKTLMTLQTLHLGILNILKKAEKGYVSLEEQTHQDPYKPILDGVLAEMESLKGVQGDQYLTRLKGVESKLAQMGLVHKAVASAFENASPGSSMAMPEVKDPNQMTPDSREEALERSEVVASFAVPGTEKPRTGINAFSGTVGAGVIPASSGGSSFAARDKGDGMPQVTFSEALASQDLTQLARKKKSLPGFDQRLEPANYELSKPLNGDSPSDRVRMQSVVNLEEEHKKSQAGLARAEDTPNRIGNTHVF